MRILIPRMQVGNLPAQSRRLFLLRLTALTFRSYLSLDMST
jgi:hypothetical protein